MRTLEQQLTYEHLELISTAQKTQSTEAAAWSLLTRIGKGIIHFFVGTREPHIWMRQDNMGNSMWYVRDPQTKQISQFTSEHDVMIWLDERFYC